MASELNGLIPKLTRGEKVSDEAIEELGRLFDTLRAEGWGGYVPADDALRAMVKPGFTELISELIPIAQKLNVLLDEELKQQKLTA